MTNHVCKTCGDPATVAAFREAEWYQAPIVQGEIRYEDADTCQTGAEIIEEEFFCEEHR